MNNYLEFLMENQTRHLPQHVAIVMDGNGRWAEQRKMPRMAGHRAGLEALRNTIKFAVKKEIAVLSVFAFSTENWRRPRLEVSGLMGLFLRALRNEAKKLHKNNIQLKVIGNISGFSPRIQEEIFKLQELTENNSGLKLVIAANYGGQWDLAMAMKKIAQSVAEKKLDVEQINEALIADHLSLAGIPDPDLFIRTSGELRISNFFLWQLAYSELYFTNAFWPDFDDAEFEKALESYAQRQRRFGCAQEVVSSTRNDYE